MWFSEDSPLGTGEPHASEARFLTSKRIRLSDSLGMDSSDDLKKHRGETPSSLQDVDPDSLLARSILLLQEDIRDVDTLVRQVEREHVELENEYDTLMEGMKSVDTTASEE